MDNGPRAELVSRHAGSLAVGGRLYDIASSDRHVLKPWFAGKVDFAPPVRDLSPSGFSLVGARLDQIGGRPVAVVVYRIRRHDISLFVSRSASSLPQPLTLGRPLGFALASWAEDGLSFDAVSDVDPQELARFAALIRTQGP